PTSEAGVRVTGAEERRERLGLDHLAGRRRAGEEPHHARVAVQCHEVVHVVGGEPSEHQVLRGEKDVHDVTVTAVDGYRGASAGKNVAIGTGKDVTDVRQQTR